MRIAGENIEPRDPGDETTNYFTALDANKTTISLQIPVFWRGNPTGIKTLYLKFSEVQVPFKST